MGRIAHMTKTRRLIELMVRVYERRHFTVDEMAEEFDVSYRTMLRYLQELSGMGVPLYSETGRHGGYTVLPSKNKPTLELAGDRTIRRVIKPAFRLLGVGLEAPFTAIHFSNALVPRLWEQLREHLAALDEKAAVRGAKPMAAVRTRSRMYAYVAGIEVRRSVPVPDGMTAIDCPSREYAVYTHHGSHRRDELDDTYLLAMERMRQQGMEPEHDAYALTVYTDGEPPEATQCEIYIPIRASQLQR
jgi:predicted transcriptional regulator YdeE